MYNETLYLERDCHATLIPAGDSCILEKGTPFLINQALGGSVTVSTPKGLFRLDRSEFSALGEEAQAWLEGELGESSDDAKIMEGPFNEDKVWYVLKTCFDPEIPVNIVDLGLIYDLKTTEVSPGRYRVEVKMTLTAQGCGMGPVIAADAKEKIEAIPGVDFAEVQIVWDPVWNPSMISEEGRRKLGLT